MKFRNNLNKILSEKNIKQEDVAFKLGIGQSAVSQWASGRTRPRGLKLDLLCGFLGVTYEELYSEIESEKTIPESMFVEVQKQLQEVKQQLLESEQEKSRLLKKDNDRMESENARLKNAPVILNEGQLASKVEQK